MKKYFALVSIMVLASVLSGCSCSTNSTVGKTAQYTISKSVWKSTDAGKTWEAKDKTNKKLSATDLDVLQIAINRQSPSNIYVGLKTGGIIKSSDGGNNWENTSFTSEKVYGLEIDPDNGQRIFASGVWQGRGKIFKTEDGGANWTEIYTKAANGPLVISLTLDPKNTNVIYATTSDNDVIKSIDGGKSWQNIYHASSPVLKMAIDRDNSGIVYLLDQYGNISKSTDGGKTIVSINENMKDTFFGGKFSLVKTDPLVSNRVYLAGESGIMRSDDAGKSWKKIVALDNPEKFPVTMLAINPYNSDELIYGASQAAYKSTDGGNNWMPFQFSQTKKVSFIEYDPTNPNNVYLGFSK